jgi:DNA topoisomerase-3
MQKLLATGRTDLLTQFVSRKGRRFRAYLVKTPEGKVGFEFEARAPRKASPVAAAKHAAAAPVSKDNRPSATRAPRVRGKARAKQPTRVSARGKPVAKRKSA